MKFSKEFLTEELGYSTCKAKVVSSKMIDQRRWVTVFRDVFELEGHFYKTVYEVGSTECQETERYEYEDDPVECEEVFPVEKTVIVYEPKE